MPLKLLLLLVSVAALIQPCFAAASTPETICRYLESDGKRTKIPGGYLKKDEQKDQQIYFRFRPNIDNWSVAVVDIRDKENKLQLMVRLQQPCKITQARQAVYDKAGKLLSLQTLGPDLVTVTAEDVVNPAVPDVYQAVEKKNPLLAIADTGVNYLLPEIQPHIARTANGNLLGYDFWDMDERPFDSDPRQNPYYPFHHGTTVFSVLAAEAPGEAIAVYRFPAINMCRYKELINHAVNAGVRVMNISMGSNNIDEHPVYPAALSLDNLFVVSSSDHFGRPGAASNTGSQHVDIFVPAEQVSVTDHRGVRTTTGGTSYAAPRVAALAVRYLRANPDADTQQIISFLQKRAISGQGNISAFGWIPDPTDDYGF